MKLVDDYSEMSMQHLMALDRRTINLWGEATGKTLSFRMKKDCILNVSTSSIYGYNRRLLVLKSNPRFWGEEFISRKLIR